MINLTHIDSLMQEAAGRLTPAAQLTVRWHGEAVLSRAYGWLDPETRQRPAQLDTLFDLASVTKLFATTAFMRLAEAGHTSLDAPVASVLNDFAGLRPIQPYEDPQGSGQLFTLDGASDETQADASRVTFRHLLTHSAGLPPWRPLFRQADAAAAKHMALSTYFSYSIGTRVIYSDVGLVLLGMAIEQLSGQRLDEAVRHLVCAPLQLQHTTYLPADAPSTQRNNVAPTEWCKWRQRRVVAEVHDENASWLGGISGHAGLFSTAGDVARFGQAFLDGGQPLLSAATVAEMTREQAREGDVRRGLGFALWSPDPEASGNPFGQRAFGHTGFTGTSLWMDPERDLVVALLANDVYYGREGRTIGSLRVQVHRAVVDAIDAA